MIDSEKKNTVKKKFCTKKSVIAKMFQKSTNEINSVKSMKSTLMLHLNSCIFWVGTEKDEACS